MQPCTMIILSIMNHDVLGVVLIAMLLLVAGFAIAGPNGEDRDEETVRKEHVFMVPWWQH